LTDLSAATVIALDGVIKCAPEALNLYLEVAKERNQETVEDSTRIAEMAMTL